MSMSDAEFEKKFPLGFMYVPCGKCLPCRIARSREWSLRCMHEFTSWNDACFVTFTYDDANLPANSTLVLSDFQNFWKRLRKLLGKRKIRYYGCGEYGERSDRPHYHAVIFGLSVEDAHTLIGLSSDSRFQYLNKERTWNKGFIFVGTVTYDSIRYVTQYIDKKYSKEMNEHVYYSQNRIPPFQVCSIGIGKQFCDKEGERMKKDLFTSYKGVKYSIPRYYRKRLKMPSEVFRDKAIETTLERYNRLTPNTVNNSQIHEQISKSRKQSEATLRAKLSMREKKL